MSSKVKGNEVNWNTTYDLLYVFYINFGHDQDYSGDTAQYKLNYLIWSLKVIQDQRSWSQLKDHIYHIWLTIYVFHRNLCHNMHHSEDKAP